MDFCFYFFTSVVTLFRNIWIIYQKDFLQKHIFIRMCWILSVQVRPTRCYKCLERSNVWKLVCYIYLASYQTLYMQSSVWCYPLTFKQRTALWENIAHSLHNSLLVLITALVIYAMFLVRDKSDQPVVSWTPPPPKQGWVWVCPTGNPPHRSRFPLIIRVTKSENFPDSKIFVAKTFRIKRVNFQIRDKCA